MVQTDEPVILLSESGSLDGWESLRELVADKGARLEVFDGRTLPEAGICEAVEFLVAPFIRTFGNGEILSAFPNLRVVQTLSAGYDHVARVLPKGIELCSASGVNAQAVAEMAVGLALMSRRELFRHVEQVRQGHWNEADASPGLAGRSVLVVGHGKIGRVLADTLQALGCETTVIASSSRNEATPWGSRAIHAIDELDELLPLQDVVFLSIPSTAATAHLFDAERLARMAHGALLVNVARGDVVDAEALATELRAGRLFAASDVWDREPPTADIRAIPIERLILTPHVGGNSTIVRRKRTELLREQLLRFLEDRPLLNAVDVNAH